MPDPIGVLSAFVAAAVTSLVMAVALRMLLQKSTLRAVAAISVVAVGTGLFCGYAALRFAWVWPPGNALNRFLTLILPVTLVVEFVAAIGTSRGENPSPAPQLRSAENGSAVVSRMRFAIVDPLRVLALVLRSGLYLAVVRILLHGSVYLDGGTSGAVAWTAQEQVLLSCGSLITLTVVGCLLCRLARRSSPGSIVMCLVMALVCAGLATMMGGYLRGGVAAIPFAAALLGAIPLARFGSGSRMLEGVLRVGIVGLFSLLLIGRFFGQLTDGQVAVVFLAPLLSWISELSLLRNKSRRLKWVVRLVAITIPLAGVLFFAKRDFDRKFAALVATAISAEPIRASD